MSLDLSHPFFLLLTGAVLTGVIIPRISRRWQNYQKELDLKTELVSEMSESVMTILMTIQFNLSNGDESSVTANSDELREKSKEWQIRNCVIGSKLHAYFPDHQLHEDWTTFSNEIVEACKETTKDNWTAKKSALLTTKAKLIKLVLNLNIEGLS